VVVPYEAASLMGSAEVLLSTLKSSVAADVPEKQNGSQNGAVSTP
jgi:hypothetical protein